MIINKDFLVYHTYLYNIKYNIYGTYDYEFVSNKDFRVEVVRNPSS